MLPLQMELFLPHDVIFAILCCLPVSSLLRFKSVCKDWNSIIQDSHFINEHIRRSKGLWLYTSISTNPSPSRVIYRHITSRSGLILEKDNFTQNYRLRNPCTRKIIDLPEPNKNVCGSIRMCYIPSKSDVKLVYPHLDAGNSHGCCKILTAGTDSTWRTINLPFSCTLDSVIDVDTVLIDSVYYVMRLSNDLEMICLEMENEHLSRIKIPKSFFLDWARVWPVEWEGKLSLACIEDDGLHLWALDNWREQKWAENKNVVTWTLFWKDPKRRNLVPCSFDGEGRLAYSNDAMLDRETQLSAQRFLYYFEPSMVHVKGMQRDDETRHEQTGVNREILVKLRLVEESRTSDI